MTNYVETISHLKPYKGSNIIYVRNGNKLPITHAGDTCIAKLNL